MELFGLIGKSLKHSFSERYFREKFQQKGLSDHEFRHFELPEIAHLKKLLAENKDLRGLSVTIPYKTAVMPLLDSIDPTAEFIGAVNCIKIRDGRLHGFNTDASGFMTSLQPFLSSGHERALVLGTGGAAKAVAYGLETLGIPVLHVSRSPALPRSISYADINAVVMQQHRLVINATPLGMFPDVDACPPVPYGYFTTMHLAYDLIYNPEETLFLKKARSFGAVTVNGLSMLKHQAEKSWEIWKQ
jgi:shikimate dehydrogenase